MQKRNYKLITLEKNQNLFLEKSWKLSIIYV